MAGQPTKEDNLLDWDWDRVVKVTCHNNCSYQKPCILNAYVKDGAIVRLEQSNTHPRSGDPDVPDWEPRGCQKGLVSHLHDARRILYPSKRAGDRKSTRLNSSHS